MYTVVRIVIAVGTIEDKEDMMVTFRLAFLLEASPFSLYVCHFICFVSMVYSLIVSLISLFVENVNFIVQLKFRFENDNCKGCDYNNNYNTL